MATVASFPRRRPATAAPSLSAATIPVPAGLRRLLMLLIMAATIMQVLDSTIANVALPHMQAALSATPDTITWVLTSYIVAAAIATPLTGWLGDRFGRRSLLLVAVGGFTIASILCGISTSLPLMVLSRLLQGMFGAFIGPLGQSMILDINPREKHPQAMTLWGMGIMIAPVLGPVLGGWLTDSFNWRWVFFINVPIGIFTFLGLLVLMPKIPNTPRRFDFLGFLMLFLGLAALQIMLDRGSQLDWFNSTEIVVEAMLAVGAAWIFVVHTASRRNTVLSSQLFRDRNLVLCSLFVLVIMGILIASSALLPPFLQRLMGHTAYSAGLVTAPRGVGMMVSMIVSGRLVRSVDPRIMILTGLALTMTSMHMIMGFTLQMGSGPMIWSGAIQGLGLGFVLMPLNLVAFATLDPSRRTEAAGLYNLARNIGGSVAISSMTSIMAGAQQVSHSDLASHITAQSIPMVLSPILGQVGQAGSAAFQMLDIEINRQAALIAFIDGFYVMFWTMACVVPFVLLLRPPKRGAEAAVMVSE